MHKNPIRNRGRFKSVVENRRQQVGFDKELAKSTYELESNWPYGHNPLSSSGGTGPHTEKPHKEGITLMNPVGNGKEGLF